MNMLCSRMQLASLGGDKRAYRHFLFSRCLHNLANGPCPHYCAEPNARHVLRYIGCLRASAENVLAR